MANEIANQVLGSPISQAITDPLTGQTLAPNHTTTEPTQEATPFSQVLSEKQKELELEAEAQKELESEEQKDLEEKSSFQNLLASKGDEEIKRLRLDIVNEIKEHMTNGDVDALEGAQERYNQCTATLRQRAAILIETTPTASTPIPGETSSPLIPQSQVQPIPPMTTQSQIQTAIPMPPYQSQPTTSLPQPQTVPTLPQTSTSNSAPQYPTYTNTQTIPLYQPQPTIPLYQPPLVPQTENTPISPNIISPSNPLQLLNQQNNTPPPPLIYNQNLQNNFPSVPGGVILPQQLYDPRLLTYPFRSDATNQQNQWNQQQLQMLQLQLQQGTNINPNTMWGQ